MRKLRFRVTTNTWPARAYRSRQEAQDEARWRARQGYSSEIEWFDQRGRWVILEGFRPNREGRGGDPETLLRQF
jgi:hypothetical protein